MKNLKDTGGDPPREVPQDNILWHKDNLAIWDKVWITDPNLTNKVPGGMKATSINAMSQIEEATRAFGPLGVHWGLTNLQREIVSFPGTDVPFVLVVSADFYFPAPGGKKGSFPLSTGFSLMKKGKINTNAWKSAETDLLTKALSKIGFNADVYKGKFDDSAYTKDAEQYHEVLADNKLDNKLADFLASNQLADLEKRVAEIPTVKELAQLFREQSWYSTHPQAKALFTARKKALASQKRGKAEHKDTEEAQPQAEEKTPEPKAQPQDSPKTQPKKVPSNAKAKKGFTAGDKVVDAINKCVTLRELKALYNSGPEFKEERYHKTFAIKNKSLIGLEVSRLNELLEAFGDLDKLGAYKKEYASRFPDRFNKPEIKEVFLSKEKALSTANSDAESDSLIPVDKYANV